MFWLTGFRPARPPPAAPLARPRVPGLSIQQLSSSKYNTISIVPDNEVLPVAHTILTCGMRSSEFTTVAIVPWICYGGVNSIFWICYSTVYLDESRPHDLKWTVDIISYRGLPAVASATAEDPDPLRAHPAKARAVHLVLQCGLLHTSPHLDQSHRCIMNGTTENLRRKHVLIGQNVSPVGGQRLK
jgi:hypothetical protein